MIIKKPFDDFKLIVNDKENCERLFNPSPYKWFDFYRPLKTSVKRNENNKIHLDILIDNFRYQSIYINQAGKEYNVEFIKNPTDGYIKIKNAHPVTSLYFLFFNLNIKTRIIKNWNSVFSTT